MSGLPISGNKSCYCVTFLRDPPTLEIGCLTTNFSCEL